MDPVTHGLTGALIGKAFFAERSLPGSSRGGRIATFAATLGAVFPDIDVVAGPILRNDLATIEWHRGVTHSFVGLPFFAAALAALTRWYARRRGIETPSWGALTVIYGLGLASHILLDLITSFGTMIWSPLNYARPAWDLAFIIDFTMTAIVLLPQPLAWVYGERAGSVSRAIAMWALFTALVVMAELLMQWARFPFSPWVVAVASLLFAGLFFLPVWQGWGFRVRRLAWARAGLAALVAYLGLCAVAHQAALRHVEQFAASQGLQVEHLGALPLPPSAAHWMGLIRTPQGVYEAEFNLLRGESSAFRFFADAAPNGYIEAARQLPKVRTYLWFARFPVFRFAERGDRKFVQVSDLRFSGRRNRPTAFTFRVTFDAAGRVVEQGWVVGAL